MYDSDDPTAARLDGAALILGESSVGERGLCGVVGGLYAEDPGEGFLEPLQVQKDGRHARKIGNVLRRLIWIGEAANDPADLRLNHLGVSVKASKTATPAGDMSIRASRLSLAYRSPGACKRW